MSSASDTQALFSPASLIAMVRDFDRDASSYRKRITDVQQCQPELFYQAAIEIFKRDVESRGSQFLVALLVSQKLLFRALSDPALDRESAMALAQQALRGDPLVDIALARELADASVAVPGADTTATAERLIEILDKISDGKRILPSLMRVLRNSNPFLRSKAVLMIGRSGGSLAWVKRRLEESDMRVRANAVEALWGMDDPEARELLEGAARDGNNRVAGNALLGLYWRGDLTALPELVKMAGHHSASFRRTAAWVMGETGDPRFSEVVGKMLSDRSAEVRKNAFAAVKQIRTATTQLSQMTEWQISGASTTRDRRTGQRRISVAAVTVDGRETPRVQPVQFLLTENGQTVWSYRVTERPFPPPMSVIFIYPRIVEDSGKAWDRGALRCIEWKRPTDLWCTIPYSASAPPTAVEGFQLPSFIANSVEAARAFQETPKRMDCTGFWTAMQRALDPGNGPTRGKRHLIVLAPDDVGDNPDAAILAAAHSSHTSLDVVSGAANAALREACRKTNGHFHPIVSGDSIENRVAQTYLNLLARYDIRYPSASAEAGSLRLRIQTRAGWGETTVALPAWG